MSTTDRLLPSGRIVQVPDDDPIHNGCLMVNTAVELGKTSAEVKHKVEAYRQMFVEHFRKSLEGSSVPEAADRAELLIGLFWGALITIRLSGSKSAAKPMAAQILKLLASWKS